MSDRPNTPFECWVIRLTETLDQIPMTARQRDDAQRLIDNIEGAHRGLETEIRQRVVPDVRAETWMRIIASSDEMVREIEKRHEAGAYIALDSFIRRCAEEDGVKIPNNA